ncbi:outer membrane lipoprotein-sorting protein [Hydrogenophaga sp.]|uniref:outer membrane lipoprotein-sorting protein n=1 Tax=Hydrogenophaga sp. TaxID=1904254 RepID=UPI002FC798EB
MAATVWFSWLGSLWTAPGGAGAKQRAAVRRAMGLVFLIALLLSSAVLADDGAKLAQRVHDRPDGKDSTSVVTMSLTEEGKPARIRGMVVFRASAAGGQVSTLIRFTDPADIQGTGLLTIDGADGMSNQWIYLPAMQRVRRVDSNRKGGRFVNSDYYFEDLRDRKPTMDAHRLLGRERVGDTDCEMLESVPVDASNSVYVRRVSWIDPKSLLPLRIDFFERNADQPSKRLLVVKREQIQGYWTVMDSTLNDLASGHQTRLTVGRVLYDRNLPESLFTSRALAEERMEREFRP